MSPGMISDNILSVFRKKKGNEESIVQKFISQNDNGTTIKDDEMSIDNFIGQPDAISLLKVSIDSAKIQDKPVDHILFYGFPGLGKNRLAHAIAYETGSHLYQCLGSELSSSQEWLSLLRFLRSSTKNKIVFIDEIHSLPKKKSELLYELVQDFSIRCEKIMPFTLIGATTYVGAIDKPLRNRFNYIIKLNYYSAQELKEIIKNVYQNFTDDVALYIAEKSRGTPRIALSYAKITNNAAIYEGVEIPDKIHVDFSMEMMKINKDGYTEDDISILVLLYTEGKPIGRQSICSIINIDQTDYQFNVEPILLQSSLISITPRGRCITEIGISYLRDRGYIK